MGKGTQRVKFAYLLLHWLYLDGELERLTIDIKYKHTKLC